MREESTEERRGKSEEPGGVRNMVVFFIPGCVFPLAGSCLLLVRHKAASTRERVSDSKNTMSLDIMCVQDPFAQ